MSGNENSNESKPTDARDAMAKIAMIGVAQTLLAHVVQTAEADINAFEAEHNVPDDEVGELVSPLLVHTYQHGFELGVAYAREVEYGGDDNPEYQRGLAAGRAESADLVTTPDHWSDEDAKLMNELGICENC